MPPGKAHPYWPSEYSLITWVVVCESIFQMSCNPNVGLGTISLKCKHVLNMIIAVD